MRIIHFLNWNINSIIDHLDYVKKQNFDVIQINPVQPFKKVPGNLWWATYQPLDFSIGNVYGTKEDLIKLCREAKKRNIKIVVDVITNHLANEGDDKPLVPNKNINPVLKNNKNYWKNQKDVGNFYSYSDIIHKSIGLPGLNLNNEELQSIIIKFLDELKNCGVSGLRFDAAKHIGLPSDGVSYFKNISDFLAKNNMFGYAEFLGGPHISPELSKILEDKKNEFTELMYILTEEHTFVRNHDKKVTFVESHDTYLNDHGFTKYHNTKDIINEYCELTKKYSNTIFYVRDLSEGKKINNSNPDRSVYSDKSWINSQMIRVSNLNKGNEIKNYDILSIEENEILKIHEMVSMKINKILLNEIKHNSSKDDSVKIVILAYKIQAIINALFKVRNFDEYIIDELIDKLSEYRNKYPSKYYYYRDIIIEAFNKLKEQSLISDDISDRDVCKKILTKY